MIATQLTTKLDKIKSGHYQPSSFIIADAKDGDMAFGIAAPGPVMASDGPLLASDGPALSSEKDGADVEYKSRADYLAAMTAMAESDLIDILLMSASSAETLHAEKLFTDSNVTPAVRLNDTTDIWSARGSSYRDSPSVPFATVDLEAVRALCQLGLYSVTFSNNLQADHHTLEQYKQFRLAAREAGMQHFLEVFNPAFDIGLKDASLGDFINDMILKTLAGVTQTDAPLFLKMQFNGQRAMSDLCAYDPANLVVGILGGSAGTTRDTFELAKQAEQAGARVALFGRKINLSESPVELVRLLRSVIEEKLTAEQAVVAYHDHLSAAGIRPRRALKTDSQITDSVLMRD